MYKLTSQQKGTVFSLAPGGYAKVSPELVLTQNQRRLVRVRFLLTSLESEVILLGAQTGRGSSANCKLSVKPDGSLVYLVSGDGDTVMLPANSININDWYEVEILEFGGTSTNCQVRLNGELLNEPFPRYGPLMVNFIGLGANPFQNNKTVYFEHIKLEYPATGLDLLIKFDAIPTTKSVAFGTTTVTFLDESTINWFVGHDTAKLTGPSIDLSGESWELELDFRPSKTAFRPGKVIPLLTNPEMTKGLFLSQQGTAFLSKGIDLNYPAKTIYPSVSLYDSGLTQIYSSNESVNISSNGVWSLEIEFYYTQAVYDKAKQMGSYGQGFMGQVNSAAVLIVNVINPDTYEVQILASTKATTVITYNTILPPSIFKTFMIRSNGTTWELLENGSVVGSASAPVGSEMPTVNHIVQTGTPMASSAVDLSRTIVFKKAIGIVSGTIIWYFDHKSLNPFYLPVEMPTFVNRNQYRNVMWYNRSRNSMLTHYIGYPGHLKDLTGNTIVPVWDKELAQNFIEHSDRVRLILHKTAAGLDWYLNTKTYPIARFCTQGLNSRLSGVVSLPELNSLLAHLTDLNTLYGLGVSDVFSLRFVSGSTTSVWNVDSSGQLVDTLGQRPTFISENFTTVNIPDPSIIVSPGNSSYSKLSDIPFTALLSANPSVVVSVTGSVVSDPVVIASGQNSNLTIQGTNPLSGNFLDDQISRVSFTSNNLQACLVHTGNNDVVVLKDIEVNQVAGKIAPVVLSSGTAAGRKNITLDRVGITGIENSPGFQTSTFAPAIVKDTIVTRFGSNAILLQTAGSLVTKSAAIKQTAAYTDSVAISVAGTLANSLVLRAAPNGQSETSATTFYNLASGQSRMPIAVTKNDFQNFDALDFRFKSSSSLYNTDIAPLAEVSVKNEETEVGKGSVLGLAPAGSVPSMSAKFLEALQEIVKAFYSSVVVMSSRFTTKETSTATAATSTVTTARTPAKTITNNTSAASTVSSGKVSTKETSKGFVSLASVSRSQGLLAKQVTTSTQTLANILSVYNYIVALGISGSFASTASIIATMLANKTALASHSTAATVSSGKVSSKSVAKPFYASAVSYSNAGIPTKVSVTYFADSGTISRSSVGSKTVLGKYSAQVLAQGNSSGTKQVSGSYATNVYLYRWTEYEKLYEILGTFVSNLSIFSSGSLGTKTASTNISTNATILRASTSSKEIQAYWHEALLLSAEARAKKEVALPLESARVYAGTNYLVEKTSYSGYNTSLVVTMSMRGSSKDTSKDVANYITQSRSIISINSESLSTKEYYSAIHKNNQEYNTSTLSVVSLDSVSFALNHSYKTRAESLLRY